MEDKKSKKKPGCFIHLVQRIGRTIRRLTRRVRKRTSVVSPVPQTDTGKIQIKSDTELETQVVSKEVPTEGKDDIESRENVSAERTEDEKKIQSQEGQVVNGAETEQEKEDGGNSEENEEDLEEFAEGYVKINLEKISSMFVAKELTDGGNDGSTDTTEN